MKKTLLTLSFCILSSATLYAEEDTSTTSTAPAAQAESSPVAVSSVPSSGLGDSFMAAFGMDAPAAAGDTGEGGPGNPSARGAQARALGPGMSSMSSAVANQVTRPFTPYSYKHGHGK